MTSFFSTAPAAAPLAVAPSPLVCSIPDLPAPSLSPSCEEEWKRFSASKDDAVVYGLAWRGQHLAAVTSSGQVCIWNVPTRDEDEDMDQVEILEIFQKQRHPAVK